MPENSPWGSHGSFGRLPRKHRLRGSILEIPPQEGREESEGKRKKMAEFPMTQQGYDEAVKKLEYLRKAKRAEIVPPHCRGAQPRRPFGERRIRRGPQRAGGQRARDRGAGLPDQERRRSSRRIADNSAVHFGSVVQVHDMPTSTRTSSTPSWGRPRPIP